MLKVKKKRVKNHSFSCTSKEVSFPLVQVCSMFAEIPLLSS